MRWDIPDAYELDRDVNRKGFLEFGGLLPSFVVGSGIHLVCEWYLLEISGRKQSNFVQHACEARGPSSSGSIRSSIPEGLTSPASRICAARET